MKAVLVLSLLLSGCAHYRYKNGDCELSILSMRELQAVDIRITESCELKGGADSLTYNEKQLEILGHLVNKIP